VDAVVRELPPEPAGLIASSFGERPEVVGLAGRRLRVAHDEEPHARKDTTGAVGTSL
jgi:hypothetical protein